MSKSFDIPLSGDVETLVAKAEEGARQAGAEFSGDTSGGRFAGFGVEGQYTVQGDTITVTITKKPMIAPWSLVEGKVRSFFV